MMEADLWSAEGLVSNLTVNACTNNPALGGIGVLNTNGYFERTFSSLPPHDMVYFRMRLLVIDAWKSPDTVSIQIDDRSATAGDIALSRPTFGTNYCGDPKIKDNDEIYFKGKLEHANENITLRIVSQINRSSNVASFGVRRVTLLFVNKSIDETETSCVTTFKTMASKDCGCPTGSYKNPLNSSDCLLCHPNCQDCFGPLASQCFACNYTSGCSYVGKECIQCAPGCLDCFGPESNQCLKCVSSYWSRYGISHVLPACDSPTYAQETVGQVNLCKTPCYPDEFYLWNTSCSKTCDWPYIPRTTNFGQFCDWPCSNTSEYLYWNNTCRSNCNFPYVQVQDYGKQRCFLPCKSNEYLYPR